MNPVFRIDVAERRISYTGNYYVRLLMRVKVVFGSLMVKVVVIAPKVHRFKPS
jgi:hypothetical protein